MDSKTCAVHNSGKDVAKAQKWLKNLGSSINVNGKFTIGMTTAICSFQRRYDIPVTGILDETTWKTLRAENSPIRKLFRKVRHS